MQKGNFSRLQTGTPSSSQSSPYPILSVKGRKGQKGFPLNSSPDKGRLGGVFGFTLVELIIVITILAILATIAFMSFQGYTEQSRDSNRLATLKSIEKGLTIFQTKSGVYPETSSGITITASGTTIGYQGSVGENVVRAINMNLVPLDPVDNQKYVYATNEPKSKYQLMAFMEGEDNLIGYFSPTYASDMSKRFPLTIGDNLGIVLDTNSNLITGTSGIDIITTNTPYQMYISTTQKLVGTGNVLKAGIAGGGLVGYWDFDEGNGTIAYDKSGNNNNGTFTGIVIPTRISGKIGNSILGF